MTIEKLQQNQIGNQSQLWGGNFLFNEINGKVVNK